MARVLCLLVVAVSLAVGSSAAPVGFAQSPNRSTTVLSFDPQRGELPEGLAVDEQGTLYVSMGPSGAITRVSPQGEASPFAQLPDPSPGFLLGLAYRDGWVYAVLNSGDPATHGIWRTRGGAAERFAALEPGFPNGLVFWGDDLYVSDSGRGSIWKVSPQGQATTWVQHDWLLGDPADPRGFPVGANGLVVRDGWLYIANTDYGRIVRVPVMPDGSAGAPEVFLDYPSLLYGADGLAIDATGQLYVTAWLHDRLLRIAPSGEISILAEGLPLQSPASVEIVGNVAYVTSFAAAAALGLEPGPPQPALVRIALP